MVRNVSFIFLASGVLLMVLTFGIRQTSGLFLPPLHEQFGWSIGALSLAWAVQNLLWGAAQPIAGAIADTRGPVWVVLAGGLMYASGLYLMSKAQSPLIYGIGSGVLIGLAMSCSSMSVVLGAVMRVAPPEKRGLCGGIVTAGGSIGQLIFMPSTQALIGKVGAQPTLQILAAAALGIAICAFGLPRVPKARTPDCQSSVSLGTALKVALGDPNYLLLVAGFFVCGFHLSFIGFHLPQFAALCGLKSTAAAEALALVGGFNAVGCIMIGFLMGKTQTKYLLGIIYFGRAMAIAAFFLLPVTETSIRLFGAAMGLLWLSTVPATSGLIAQLFGTRYLSMLFGIAIFSHQIGSFIGGYWAGWLFDEVGNYDAVWWVSIALGVFSGLINLPIRERRPALVPV